MKKKSLFILLFVMCIGFFIPKEVFAEKSLIKTVNYYINIDYKIESDSSVSYKLYDRNNTFNFESTYNGNNMHIFAVSSTDSFKSFAPDFYNYLENFDYIDYDFSNIIVGRFPMFKQVHFDLSGNMWNGTNYLWTSIATVPMILEERPSMNKKIVFATIHNFLYHENHRTEYYNNNYHQTDDYMNQFFEFTLTNNNAFSFGYNSDPNNIQFMTNTIYDYSDGLWNELNSRYIASSELNDFVEEYIANNAEKTIYSKYKSNVNYKFKVKNGNGMNFKLHDVSNTFSFNSKYDKNSDTYSIVDNSSDSNYQEGIKNFSKIIIDEVKNGNFNELADKYNSITSDNCTSTNCNIYTYIPMILEGQNNNGYAKKIVLGLLNVQYRQESGNDYYDIELNIYNNTCDLINSNIDALQSDLINLSRAIEKDYSNSLINKYSNGSVALEDIYKDVDVNSVKGEYCKDVPVITLRKNPLTMNNGVIVLIISMIVIIGSSIVLIKKRNVKI